jgi:DNA repair exonuclease SbcCD ATPase subunit
MSNKVIKLSKNNKYYIAVDDKIKNLEEILTSNISIYLYKDNFYINFNSIINYYSIEDTILCVLIKQKDYIKVNDDILVNNMGINKLINGKKIQNKKKQDKCVYNNLLDIYNKLIEMEQTIKEQTVKEQHETLKDQYNTVKNQHETLKEQYNTVKNQHETLKEQYNTVKEQYETLNSEHVTMLSELDKNKQEIKILHNKYNELKDDYDDIKAIANNLSKYVRLNNKDAPDAYSDHFDIDDDFISEQDKKKIAKNALISKKKLNDKNNIIGNKIQCNKTDATSIFNTDVKNRVYSLLRSSYIIDTYKYKWEFSANITEEFKEESENYLLDEEGSPPSNMLWYCDLSLNEQKLHAVNLFFDLVENICDESTIVKLLNF